MGKVLTIENGEKILTDGDADIICCRLQEECLDAGGITVPACYVGDCSCEHRAGIMEAIRSGYNAENEV